MVDLRRQRVGGGAWIRRLARLSLGDGAQGREREPGGDAGDQGSAPVDPLPQKVVDDLPERLAAASGAGELDSRACVHAVLPPATSGIAGASELAVLSRPD